jgi:hypothetical protein
MRGFLCLVVALAVSASGRASQEPSKPDQTAPPSAAKPEAEEEEKEAEEFKEEEPTTPAQKLKKEELERRACPKVDVKFSADTDKTQHPLGEPKAGKALVYVVRPTMTGNKIQTKLAVDGEWVGVNRGHNYFFLQLEPGEHYLCSKAENKSVMVLTVEPGKTYYVEQKIRMGFMKARNKLALLSDAEGTKKLAKCHPSSWQQKK